MTPPIIMRPMRAEDIPEVVAIDRISFPIPWSSRTYAFEINNNETSQMVVLETAAPPPAETNGLGGMFRWLLHGGATPETAVIGYGGCWLIAGEAHISTIAVHPAYRGKGLGELLLVGMLQRALNLGGEYSVLEVRISNEPAQALYRKYEYTIVGRRPGYYRDNGEDAYLMEVRPLDDAYQQRLTERTRALQQRVTFVDQFTG
jgi:[ribosomal protein S18]-alanine N-acetyltransferase